jgi:iron-sulfur cluster assembly protein
MSDKPKTDTAGTPTPSARQRAQAPAEGSGVRLTELAAKYVRQYMEKTENPAAQYVFFGVKGGGCSGLNYVLDLRDENAAPVADTDEVFVSHDIVIVCDLKSYMVGNLSGTTIDYREGMMGAGFTFINPNAKQTCGCGASYSA